MTFYQLLSSWICHSLGLGLFAKLYISQQSWRCIRGRRFFDNCGKERGRGIAIWKYCFCDSKSDIQIFKQARRIPLSSMYTFSVCRALRKITYNCTNRGGVQFVRSGWFQVHDPNMGLTTQIRTPWLFNFITLNSENGKLAIQAICTENSRS